MQFSSSIFLAKSGSQSGSVYIDLSKEFTSVPSSLTNPHSVERSPIRSQYRKEIVKPQISKSNVN